MKKETYISIPQPCHENWHAMTPQDKGRFCAGCAKTVIDFSQMSDAQVLDFFAQSKGNVCGHFAQDQIARPLLPEKKEKRKIWWMAALMPITILLNKANGQFTNDKHSNLNTTHYICGQTKPFALREQIPGDTVHPSPDKVVTGTVVDESKRPVAGASVYITGMKNGTTTDTSGKFSLPFTNSNPFAELVISCVGYEEKKLTYTCKNGAREINIEVVSLTPALMGDVIVVVGYAIPYPRVKKIDTVKTAVRKIFHTNPLKVYPNPVSRGTTLHIAVKNKGHYSIQLLDANSRLISHIPFDAVQGATVAALMVPSSITAGMYFIRLVDNTQQQYTDKIIVQ